MTELSYDQMPYLIRAHYLSHPRVMAMSASLLGLTPVDVEHSRVLELGCAVGGNIISMAESMPDSTFVGVDYSEQQIDLARELLAGTGLSNVSFECADASQLDDSLGKFDYIIMHGVYSWVPDVVRQNLLKASKKLLSENGVLYVSFNTYPGFIDREKLREMMLYHAGAETDVKSRVKMGREFAGFMAKVSSPKSPSGSIILKEWQLLEHLNEVYVAHEYMEEINAPFYIHEFADQMQEYGLQYVGDSKYVRKVLSDTLPAAVDYLEPHIEGFVAEEQYVDFLDNCSFRQAIVTHQSHHVDDHVNFEKLAEQYVVITPAIKVKQLTDGNKVVFNVQNEMGAEINISDPLMSSVIGFIADKRPMAISVKELMQRVAEKHPDKQNLENTLAQQLLYASVQGFVRLVSAPALMVAEVSAQPVALAFARHQLKEDGIVVNAWHENIVLEPMQRTLLPLLDGARDHKQLLVEMTKLTGQDAAVVDEKLKLALQGLADRAMLVA